jgi:mannose-6-phosphate isomerase-like protein (cupin superfamily)
MPHVSADEALNALLVDLGETARELGTRTWRKPLVASDALRVVLLRMQPGEEPHRPHRHPRADEVMIVIEGHGTFSVGSEPDVVAGPQGVVYVPSGVVHRVQVPGPEPLVWLSIVTPNDDSPDEAIEDED